MEIKTANMTPQELKMANEHLFSDSGNRLETIVLKGNQFTKLDLRVFGNLKSLQRLDLSANKIDELNERSIGLMFANTLRREDEDFWVPPELNLSGNQLTRISRNLVPARVALDFADNPIKDIEIEISRPDEVSTSTYDQAIITAMFKGNKKTTVVDLEGFALIQVDNNDSFVRRFHPHAFQCLLPSRLKLSKAVRYLGLINCQLKSTNGLKIFPRYPNLHALSLRWNLLDRFETQWIQNMNSLQRLNLQGNQIETLDDANLFVNCPNLQHLDLSENRLRSINRRLFNGLFKLAELDLSNNPQLSNIDDGLFRSLFNLNEINMSGNNIKRLNLSKLFKSCRWLSKLDLSKNQLDNQTFNRENMRHLVNLEILCLILNDNQLENIDFIRDMTSVMHLQLKNNNIETIEKDGYNLLGRLSLLSWLDLSGNRIKSLAKTSLPLWNTRWSVSMFPETCSNRSMHLDFAYTTDLKAKKGKTSL